MGMVIIALVTGIYSLLSLLLFSACSGPWRNRMARLLLALPVLLATGALFVYGRNWFHGHGLPDQLFLLVQAGVGFLVCLACLCLTRDMASMGWILVCKIKKKERRPLASLAINFFLLVFSLVIGFYGVFSATRLPEIKTVELSLARLPKAMDGMVIAQLSDLHVGPLNKAEWLARIVEMTNTIKADLVLITGDFQDGRVANTARELAPLKDLVAKYGVFGVSGNHEVYRGGKAWVDALEACGVTMLENAIRIIGQGDAKIILAGLADSRFGPQDLDGLLGEIRRNDPDGKLPVILMEHQPFNAKRNSAFASLQLSGHTHGGQICFLHPLFKFANGGFVRGLYQVKAMQLYLHPGTSQWFGFSQRLGVPTEITRIVLRSEKQNHR